MQTQPQTDLTERCRLCGIPAVELEEPLTLALGWVTCADCLRRSVPADDDSSVRERAREERS